MSASELNVMVLKDVKQYVSNTWLVGSFKRNKVYDNVLYSDIIKFQIISFFPHATNIVFLVYTKQYIDTRVKPMKQKDNSYFD